MLRSLVFSFRRTCVRIIYTMHFAVYNVYNPRYQSLESIEYVGFSECFFKLCPVFFVIATKAQLKGEVGISEKTLEGGEKIPECYSSNASYKLVTLFLVIVEHLHRTNKKMMSSKGQGTSILVAENASSERMQF